jgi:hypothetical protein
MHINFVCPHLQVVFELDIANTKAVYITLYNKDQEGLIPCCAASNSILYFVPHTRILCTKIL